MTVMTWNDDDDEAEPKEVGNLCLMVHEEEYEVSTSRSSQFTFNELQDAFDDLMAKFKMIEIKNSLLKKMISTISKENEDLQREDKILKYEIHVLKEKIKENSSLKDFSKEKQILNVKVKHLETTLFRCVNEKEILYAILKKQKCSLDKARLGFNLFKRKVFSKIKFGSSNGKIQISCFHCHKLGHIASRCYAMQKFNAPYKGPKKAIKD